MACVMCNVYAHYEYIHLFLCIYIIHRIYIICSSSNTTLVYKLHYRLYVTGNVYNSVKQYNILLYYVI